MKEALYTETKLSSLLMLVGHKAVGEAIIHTPNFFWKLQSQPKMMMRTRADNNQIVGRTATESVQLQSSTRVRRPVQWQKKNAILIEKDRRHQINVSSSMQSPDILQQIFRSRLGTTINLQISGLSWFVKLNHYSQNAEPPMLSKQVCWNYVKSSVKPFLRFQIVRHTS